MKVYTFFTDSHKIFIDTFVKSFPFESDFDLEIKYFPQECPSAKYRTDGWKKTMKRKIEYILHSLKETPMNEYFIHSDIDIQFFKNIKSDIVSIIETSGKDILFQNDFVALCMGFFICKKNTKTINFFNKVLNQLDNFVDDQVAVNTLIKSSDLNYGVLPENYYTIGPRFGTWNGNPNIEVPKNLLMHHANWTEGIENKIKLLELIKSKQ
jgi:hypothetical protein